jgi:hypothetical protein
MPRRFAAAVDPTTAIVSATAGTVAITLAAGGAIVLVRRVSGGFASGPAAPLPWIIASAGIALIALIDAVIRGGGVGRWAGMVARLGGVLAVVAMIPLGPPAGSFVSGLAALGLVTSAALLPLRETLRGMRPETRLGIGTARHHSPPASPRDREPEPGVLAPMPAGFRQRLERFQTSDGIDRVIGRVLVDVAAGSRTGHGHLGFCPPFVAVPTVDVTSEDDGIEVVVSAAEVVPWGVRVECRLSEPAEEPLAIPVHVIAHHLS